MVSGRESRSKHPKTEMSRGKVKASIFWDADDIIDIDYREKEKPSIATFTFELLMRLKDSIPKNDRKIIFATSQ